MRVINILYIIDNRGSKTAPWGIPPVLESKLNQIYFSVIPDITHTHTHTHVREIKDSDHAQRISLSKTGGYAVSWKREMDGWIMYSWSARKHLILSLTCIGFPGCCRRVTTYKD